MNARDIQLAHAPAAAHSRSTAPTLAWLTGESATLLTPEPGASDA